MTKSEQIYPTDLNDTQWLKIRPYLPAEAKTGRPREHGWRVILNGIFYLLQSGCSSSDNGSPSGPSDSTNRTFTSSSDAGHTHSVTMARSEIDSPPSGGISRLTSSNSGHTHTFTITQAQLTTVQGGSTVSTSTSSDAGHSHTFSISKWY